MTWGDVTALVMLFVASLLMGLGPWGSRVRTNPRPKSGPQIIVTRQ